VKPILILSIILIGRSIGCFAQHQHDTLRWEFGKNDRIDVKKSVITDPLLDFENQQIHTRLYYYDEHSGTGLTFKGSVICTSNHFSKQVDMRAAKFANNSDFSSDTFRRSAEFTQSVFGDDAAFSSCLFRDTANFNRAEFGQGADFSNTVFGGIGYFSDVTLGEATTLSFTQANLPDTIDFSNNTGITSLVNFMDARFDPSKVHLIYLNKTDLSKLHLDYIHFKLLFFDPKDRTHQDSSSDEDKEIVYEGLLHNFQAAGQSDSYEILDVEYRTWLWGKKMGQLKWLPDPRRWWWYYGFRKEWVFFWALFFVGFFSVINYYRLNDLNQNVYQIADIPVLPKLGSEPFSWKRAKTRSCVRVTYSRICPSRSGCCCRIWMERSVTR